MSAISAVERVEFCRPPDLDGIEILRAEGPPRLWRVFHERYAISTVLLGASEWRYRGRHHFNRTGETSVMEPGEVHATLRVAPWPALFRVLFIRPEVVSRMAKEVGASFPSAPRLRVAQVPDPELFAAFARFHESTERDATLLERQSRLEWCLRLYLERCFEAAPSPRRASRAPRAVGRAVALLRERFAEPVSLEELSAVTGLSRYHLVRTFAREVGVPPHEYQIQLRIARARDLLASGHNGAQAAAAVGFADQSHLSRHFRRILGVSPGRYARG